MLILMDVRHSADECSVPQITHGLNIYAENNIFIELQYIIKNKDKCIFLEKWKMQYLSKYINILNTDELDDTLFTDDWEVELKWFYWKVLLSNQWKHFIANYDTSKSAKLDNYLWRYPNINKFFYFLWGACIWFIPTVYNFLTKL